MTDDKDKRNYGNGTIVEFREKVFQEPFKPHYDAYRGHVFQINTIHAGGHVELICVDDKSIVVQGHVHEDEIKYGKMK